MSIHQLPDESGIEVDLAYDRVQIRAWGDGIRVRSRRRGDFDERRLGALLPATPARAVVDVEGDAATVTHAGVTARIDGTGRIQFLDDRGETLLAEKPVHFFWPGARLYRGGSGTTHLEQQFNAQPNERAYGLGQHQHGLLNQRGTVVELVHRICEVAIPFLISSAGYGILWNSAATGRVELMHDATRWISDSGEEIDYWVTSGDPKEVVARYTAVTGRAPEFPPFASGLWQSRLRYRTQEELLSVAREYRRRQLPLAAIVIDFFHWSRLGDWQFDPQDWPDPDSMMNELSDLGVELFVSIWPSLSSVTEHFKEMESNGLLIATATGVAVHAPWPDKATPEGGFVAYYDATNPAARDYFFKGVYAGYGKHGVHNFWLDACEPEVHPEDAANLIYHAGPGSEVALRFPLDHVRGFFEGLRSVGATEIISLCRSAFVGSQRYGALVWSGDLEPTFDALRCQIPSGLNIGLSGIPWWTTDIGGFHGGDPSDPGYRELYVRWFQFGVFCPVLRLHGDREPRQTFGPSMTAGDNELWSFGEEAYDILRSLLDLRERLRGYVAELMVEASDTGLPLMRALFVETPDDPRAWEIEDEYLFGPWMLIAPITQLGQRERNVYLPAGSRWINIWSGTSFDGGSRIDVDAPLAQIPAFVRSDAPSYLVDALAEFRTASDQRQFIAP